MGSPRMDNTGRAEGMRTQGDVMCLYFFHSGISMEASKDLTPKGALE